MLRIQVLTIFDTTCTRSKESRRIVLSERAETQAAEAGWQASQNPLIIACVQARKLFKTIAYTRIKARRGLCVKVRRDDPDGIHHFTKGRAIP